ncbi:NACHT, LRR and PYD domains-containing protein 12-like [Hyperolius riggenbachi]|uniref:NACHT, LRR and PYD domains-containing protein 12-like n=1 Tax=Hyperolius riggenbachi TaxID=752182 RepID=UPI0035A3CE79
MHLGEKMATLEENIPPRSTLKQQRFFINERYVDLIVVSTDEFRYRSQNELIETGIKHEKYMKTTQSGLERIFPNKLFRWSYESQCIPRVVMLSGVPGIGKTTLMKKFVYDWVTEKLFQRFTLVFYFRLRDLNQLAEVSLEELILEQYPYLESHLENILQNPEMLLFIFDGLDESNHQMDFRSCKPCYDTKWRENVGVIVVNLVRQSLLKDCSVLITTRPTKLASIDTDFFQRITEITGFRHGDRKVYFQRFFENEELSEKAFHYVVQNDTLYTFCYIPSYCWIICTVLSMCFRAQPTNTDQLLLSLPKTVTQLFATFVANILANHNLTKADADIAKELLTPVGWMAEYGVMNHILVFEERDLESFSVTSDKHLFTCFMVESGQPPDVNYSFLHLILQEFFAALVHFMNYKPDKLQEITSLHNDGHSEMLLRFLCGLSDSSTRSMLKPYVGELSAKASRDVTNWLKQKSEEQRSGDKTKLLNVFYCLHESRNWALVLQSIGSNTDIDISEVPLTPLDCSVLSFILNTCEVTEEVNLNSCHIRNEGLIKLGPTLGTIKNLRYN